MKELLNFTYKDEIEFRGFFLHEPKHPWLFVVMEEPYYKVFLEKELFTNRAILSKQSIAQRYDMTEWSDRKRGFYPERLAKQMMVLDYLNDAAREYVFFPRVRSSKEPKYPFLDFLDTDIKVGSGEIEQDDSSHTDESNREEG